MTESKTIIIFTTLTLFHSTLIAHNALINRATTDTNLSSTGNHPSHTVGARLGRLGDLDLFYPFPIVQ